MVSVEDHSFELVVRWYDEPLPVVVPEALVGAEVLSFEPLLVGFLGGDEQ